MVGFTLSLVSILVHCLACKCCMLPTPSPNSPPPRGRVIQRRFLEQVAVTPLSAVHKTVPRTAPVHLVSSTGSATGTAVPGTYHVLTTCTCLLLVQFLTLNRPNVQNKVPCADQRTLYTAYVHSGVHIKGRVAGVVAYPVGPTESS